MSQPADSNQPHRPYQRGVAYPSKPRRHRPVNPYAEANALAMQHQDIAEKVAANFSRRTGHPFDDLRQIALMGIIQASRRFNSQRGCFRPYAREYANGEVRHFLRDKGFILKVPPSWRELNARGRKLIHLGLSAEMTASQLGITMVRWQEISSACSQRVISIESMPNLLGS